MCSIKLLLSRLFITIKSLNSLKFGLDGLCVKSSKLMLVMIGTVISYAAN